MSDYSEEPKETKLHEWLIIPKKKQIQCILPSRASHKKQEKRPGPGPISWTVSDISKAGCILTQPPIPAHFEDEQEMRRVYTLIYDVFRHKNVLTQALNDIAFFIVHPELKANICHIWLLFYDLYHRSFKKRETAVAPLATRLFEEVGLINAENLLWKCKTKLAAAVARLRIQHNALSLSDLLPPHLRNDKIQGFGSTKPVTCWVNLKKIKNINELKKEIETEFGVEAVDNVQNLEAKNYKWDSHCPNIIAFHNSLRSALARSNFVKKHKLIVQDKSFCLGAATFFKHLSDLELCGSVIQTHIDSPRTTAYLATMFSQTDKIKKLVVFSAGSRKAEYEEYFSQLGLTNISVYAERLIDVSPDANYMEDVVAVYATPPNSYSAVNDPIDLVCGRGGDLSMLEILTEAEETEEGRKRVLGILDEQRKTLKFSMSRPQIQFILYETHSGIDTENNEMVERTVKEVNKNTKLHHATLSGKLIVQIFPETNETKEINNNEKAPVDDKKTEVVPETVKLTMDSEDKLFDNIPVPDTDIFDIPKLPQLCPSEISCIDYAKDGCFLALIERKQVIRLDNKYMIQMAENRGLFGRTSGSSTRAKTKSSKKKEEAPPPPPKKPKKKAIDTEMARISAPTHTFLRHIKDTCEIEECSRCHSVNEEKAKKPIYREWWSQTTRHLMNLRTSLVKNKIIPPKNSKKNVKAIVDTLVHRSSKIDEIVAKSRGEDQTNIPVFPRLKLHRQHVVEKVPIQLPVTTIRIT